jgi:hypothetical protein
MPGEVEEDLAATAAGGFAPREVLVERYAAATGRDLSNIDYYRAFSHWRLAAIGQGVYKRYLVGAMGDNRDMDLEAYKESVSLRAESALAMLTGCKAYRIKMACSGDLHHLKTTSLLGEGHKKGRTVRSCLHA